MVNDVQMVILWLALRRNKVVKRAQDICQLIGIQNVSFCRTLVASWSYSMPFFCFLFTSSHFFSVRREGNLILEELYWEKGYDEYQLSFFRSFPSIFTVKMPKLTMADH
jgi:hypothetical protein